MKLKGLQQTNHLNATNSISGQKQFGSPEAIEMTEDMKTLIALIIWS